METRNQIKINVDDIVRAEQWCVQHVAPRTYHLHIGIGGPGWHIWTTNKTMIIDDPQLELLAVLNLNGK